MEKKVEFVTYRMMCSKSKSIYISTLEKFAEQILHAELSE